jgi:hypothetical protein
LEAQVSVFLKTNKKMKKNQTERKKIPKRMNINNPAATTR